MNLSVEIFLNRSRFERIMVMSLWPCFLAQPVDAACHYRRRAFWACVYVCVLGTPVSYAKTDKQIEMPFGGGQTRVR